MPTHDFYTDSGHGWLKVPKTELKQLGIADKISPYSYMRGEFAYLEEDCDFGLFHEAMQAHNKDYSYKTHYTDESPIRNYQSYRSV
jgi:hypothetical protein